MTFDFKIVLSRLYILICVAWVPCIFIFSSISSKYFNDGYITPYVLIIGFLCFIIFNKPIINLLFTKKISITLSDDRKIKINSLKNIQFDFNEIIAYRILFTEPKYYYVEIVTQKKKYRYTIIGDESSISFLDTFHNIIIALNHSNEIKIKLNPPIGLSKWYKRSLKISAFLLCISFFLHLYFSPKSSIGTFLIAVSTVASAYSNNITGLQFYNHLNAGNMISTFKKRR